jgi:hypothetical protein
LLKLMKMLEYHCLSLDSDETPSSPGHTSQTMPVQEATVANHKITVDGDANAEHRRLHVILWLATVASCTPGIFWEAGPGLLGVVSSESKQA